MVDLVYGSSFLPPTWPVLCFSVMNELNLDDPGFQSPGAPAPAPPSSGSSSDTATDRHTCLTCHRWMSKKTFDRHTVCVACRGSDCDIDHRCEECTEWPEEELLLYMKHRRSLKSKRSKPKTQATPPPPPAAPSMPSSHPAPRSDFESRLDLLAIQVSALSDLFQSRLAAPQAIGDFLPASHASSQARLELDARSSHPVETAGHPQESQALGGSGREPDEPVTLPYGQAQLGRDVRASAGLGWALLPSTSQAPRQPPPARGGVFAPPLSAAAPSVAAASYSDPRFALPPPVGPPRMFRLRGSRLLLPGLLVVPLLRHGAVLSLGLTPHQLRPPLGLATVFTLGLLRWNLRSRIVRLRSTDAPNLCRRFYCARSAVMQLRINRFLRSCSR